MENNLYFSGAKRLSCLPMGKNIGQQDGAIYNDIIFRFSSKGHGSVFRFPTMEKLTPFMLDKLDVLIPHSNSVCFGTQFYREGDLFPLLYSNIYNNYPTAAEKEGMCCVYRILPVEDTFCAQLVQVLKIDFVRDGDIWYSQNRKDVRPFGNFAVDAVTNKLHVFVARDETQTTRFFRFALPDANQGEMDEALGVPVFRLTREMIEQQFETPYMHYMQGACCHDGIVYSVEGFTYPKSQQIPTLRVIDTNRKMEVFTADLTQHGLLQEPEFIDVYNGKVYYSDNAGAAFQFLFQD